MLSALGYLVWLSLLEILLLNNLFVALQVRKVMWLDLFRLDNFFHPLFRWLKINQNH